MQAFKALSSTSFFMLAADFALRASPWQLLILSSEYKKGDWNTGKQAGNRYLLPA